MRDRLNAWTVGLAGGPLEGEPIRHAAEIARVVDDGDKLYVLPIVTRGAADNVEAILFLRGVDAAIINTDALEAFKAQVPDIQQRITYILNLFPSELHVFARPDITSLADLQGKKVNFNTPGTGAAHSGPLMFERLKLDVQKSFVPNAVALEQMRNGRNDMAAVVFVTAKPAETFVQGTWPPGFRFLPVETSDYGLYLPSTLTAADYPNLIQPGQDVATIAVPTVLASYNWPLNSERYSRVARLTTYLFDRLPRLQEPGFHPKWRDVNVNAQVPGMIRFPAAQEWMLRQQVKALTEAAKAAEPGAMTPRNAPQPTGGAPTQDRQFQESMERKKRQEP
ncbi:MAG: C4-dicarboxylate ABC transporter substrate-binding protein [Proteobacteria bacterium]|nr:C4-dicarboxylate ABC transporter substrate-binding protein [Pseudomonadota bacterium]